MKTDNQDSELKEPTHRDYKQYELRSGGVTIRIDDENETEPPIQRFAYVQKVGSQLPNVTRDEAGERSQKLDPEARKREIERIEAH